MRITREVFESSDSLAVTLLGMSGVGKTHISNILRRDKWFHYSGDYRIGSHYLNDAIVNNIKKKAIEIDFLRDLLLSDSIYIGNNVSVDNLESISTYLSKIGNPEQGGIPYLEFLQRQEEFRRAEYSAMMDVPKFIQSARDIYGYRYFVNDAGGSLCEFIDSPVIDALAKCSLIIYLSPNAEVEQNIIERQKVSPKPLYYSREFLETSLQDYLDLQGLKFSSFIEPDHFLRWIFKKLLAYRRDKYEKIAEEYGYTLAVEQLSKVKSSHDFKQLIATQLD